MPVGDTSIAQLKDWRKEAETAAMRNSDESRHFLAVYLIVILLAIILLLLGILTAEHTWQTVLLNLSTELLGAAIIFILITWLFRLQPIAELKRKHDEGSRAYEKKIKEQADQIRLLEQKHTVEIGEYKQRIKALAEKIEQRDEWVYVLTPSTRPPEDL